MFTHSSQQTKKKSTVVLILLWSRIAFHVLRGLLTLCFLMPFADLQQKQRKTQRWARRLLSILQVRLEVSGIELPKQRMFRAFSHWIHLGTHFEFEDISFDFHVLTTQGHRCKIHRQELDKYLKYMGL